MTDGRRLHGLDGLRAIAALLVLGLHIDLRYDLDLGFFDRAYLAVDFFFILSGFVLAKTYERDGFRHSPLQFLKLRYLRLWPPMLIGAILSALFLLSDGLSVQMVALLVLPLAFMLPNMATSGSRFGEYPINMPAWSIFAELFANALHGFVLWRLSSTALLTVAVGALLSTQFLSAGLDMTIADGFAKGLLRVLAGYCLGILLCRHYPKWRIHPVLAFAALPLGIVLLAGGAPAWLDLAFVLFCPLLVVSGASLVRGFHACTLFGALSFPLYAVHTPVIHLAQQVGIGPVWAAAVSLLAAFATAIVADRRILRYLPSRSAARSPSSPFLAPPTS